MEPLNIGLKRFYIRAGLFFFLVLGGMQAHSGRAQSPWRTMGPDGGDARSFASVPGRPEHMYLGTANSTIFESTDGGSSWRRLAKLDREDDLVIAHIVIDPRNSSRMYVAGWRFDRPEGGLYISRDAGHTWVAAPGLRNQSVFALVQAPSSSRTLIAGTLEGVFRSNDSGATWTLISPPDSKEIHEVESLAVHPVNPDIIYAGTWHLPWKTSDGGDSWTNIKQGVIDDSDVFSILIDPETPSTVYASACSGIYKSETAGKAFHKIQGIPATARRTRVLKQDPMNREIVYAGTTEGLYKTTDAGKTFRRMTGPDVIVNDVWIDPENPSRVLLATDRGGVLASDDAAETFVASNRGFSARKVEALLVDPHNPSKIYAGVVNDKAYGGAFVSIDGGREWKQIADGLDGRDVFVLDEAQDGTIVAGTNSGIFALAPDDTTWAPRGALQSSVTSTPAKPVKQPVHGKPVKTVKQTPTAAPIQISSRVYSVSVSGDVWVAATATGVYLSNDQGATWANALNMGEGEFQSVAVHGSIMAAAQSTGLVLSKDSGENWSPVSVPMAVTHIYHVVFSRDGTIWLGAREGLYFSRNLGRNWMWIQRLPLVDVSGLFYDARQDRILASSRGSDFVYSIDTKSLTWTWQKTGFPLLVVRSASGGLIAATVGDGILAESATEEAKGGESISTKTAQ